MEYTYKGFDVTLLKTEGSLSLISEMGTEIWVKTTMLKAKKAPRVSREIRRAEAEAKGTLPSYSEDHKGREWRAEYAAPGALAKWAPILLAASRLHISSGTPEKTASEIAIFVGTEPKRFVSRGESSNGAKFDLFVKDSIGLASAPKELGIWFNSAQQGLKFDEVGIGSRGLSEYLMERGLVPEEAHVVQ
jgi:hypothetical protein